MLAALAWAGGIACAVLVLAGNAVSRATAYTALDEKFRLDPNTRRLFEWAGFPAAALLTLGIVFLGFLVFAAWLLTVSGALAFRPSPVTPAQVGATP